MRAHLTVLALSLLPLPAAAQYHMEDTLRGSTSGNAIGGSFGPDGWTVTGASDRIWYALPRLVSGYVEVTVTGVDEGTNLPLADHEIFAMYEDGYGIGEPIDYGSGFRQNHYKVMVRIYGAPEAERTGAMKLMWGMCPSGAPGRDACGCESFFEEPFRDPGDWNGAASRIRVEWNDGSARLLRDGAEVVSVSWDDTELTFGPSDLHMMLGSPRNDGGLAAMPIGAVFSDLVVDGTMGELATCPSTPIPDAGVPIDGGTCTGGAIADATAASWESGVFPDAFDLNVEGGAGGSGGVAYLRFPAVSGTVTSATLTMATSGVPSAGGGSGQVCRVEGSWDEATLTWSTRPTVSTTCSGGARTVGGSETVTWDVTSLVSAGGPVNLAIVSTDSDGTHYFSRESGGCASGPRLDVVTTPGSDSGGLDAGGVDGGGADAPGLDASAPGADTGPRRRGEDGGCGCAVVERRAPGAAVVLATLALAAVTRGRRGRRRGGSSA